MNPAPLPLRARLWRLLQRRALSETLLMNRLDDPRPSYRELREALEILAREGSVVEDGRQFWRKRR